jgi:hypothetical protein
MHSILRRQAVGQTPKWRKQDHGKESAEEGKKARSHQAVDGYSLIFKPAANLRNEKGGAFAPPFFFRGSSKMV